MGRIYIRVPDKKKNKIRLRAEMSGKTITEYMVEKALKDDQEILKSRLIEERNKNAFNILKELKAWGNNLNQIARGVNRANKEGTFELKQQLRRDILQIKDKLTELETKLESLLNPETDSERETEDKVA